MLKIISNLFRKLDVLDMELRPWNVSSPTILDIIFTLLHKINVN